MKHTLELVYSRNSCFKIDKNPGDHRSIASLPNLKYLDRGFYFMLHDNANEWMIENNIKYSIKMVEWLNDESSILMITFDNDDDLILFKMRWC